MQVAINGHALHAPGAPYTPQHSCITIVHLLKSLTCPIVTKNRFQRRLLVAQRDDLVKPVYLPRPIEAILPTTWSTVTKATKQRLMMSTASCRVMIKHAFVQRQCREP